VHAITQTPDGYLWIGTDKGLVRFDGLNFTLVHRPTPEIFPDNPVLGLTTDADGNMWVRMQSLTVLRYHDGEFENATANMEPREVGIPQCAAEKMVRSGVAV
jgi:ligand-binding sensor domain-containing protein